jgi:hypothetical protein
MKAQIEPEGLFNYHQHCNYYSLRLSIVLDFQDWRGGNSFRVPLLRKKPITSTMGWEGSMLKNAFRDTGGKPGRITYLVVPQNRS